MKIKVVIELHDNDTDNPTELARIEVSEQTSHGGGEVDYSIKAVVRNQGGDIRVIQRPLLNFHNGQWNSLGLLAQCLELLGPDVMRGKEQNELEPY